MRAIDIAEMKRPEYERKEKRTLQRLHMALTIFILYKAFEILHTLHSVIEAPEKILNDDK